MNNKSPTKFWNPHDITQLKAIPGIEILFLIGSGGLGAVYLARQLENDRLIAVKVPRVYDKRERELKSLIVHEAQVMTELNHKNIVKIFDFGINDGQVWITMELIEGSTFRDLLDLRLMTPRRAFELIHQLCEGLDYAHQRGIIHQDLKPENILVNYDNEVKIADFGLSQVPHSSYTIARLGKRTGTFGYIAPELYDRLVSSDYRSDIYSLGVVMYELFTGQKPIGNYLPPSHYIGGGMTCLLDPIIIKCLSPKANDRWQSVKEILTALKRISNLKGSLVETCVLPQSSSDIYPVESTRTHTTSSLRQMQKTSSRANRGTVKMHTNNNGTDIPHYTLSRRKK